MTSFRIGPSTCRTLRGMHKHTCKHRGVSPEIDGRWVTWKEIDRGRDKNWWWVVGGGWVWSVSDLLLGNGSIVKPAVTVDIALSNLGYKCFVLGGFNIKCICFEFLFYRFIFFFV